MATKGTTSTKGTTGANGASGPKTVKRDKAGNASSNVMPFPASQQTQQAQASQANPVMFGALLKERRKKAQLSQKDFADMMHVTRNTVINWEADKSKPDYSLIPEVCTLLNIRVHELFHMQAENGLNALETRIVENVKRLNPISRKVVDKMISTMVDEELRARERELKEAFDIFLKRPGSLAAGVGNYVPDERPEYVFLRKNHINARADGIALVDGDSMEPVYHSGDYVYYKEACTADPGEDVLVDTDDGAVIKRMDDDHTLYSVNPDIPYPSKTEQNTLVIRGIVLGVVASSDKPSDEDAISLEELFVDEIREFNEEHGIDEWE